VRDGAPERRERWRAQRDAFAELRAERIAARAVLFSGCAETRRRAREIRVACELVRVASREQRAASKSGRAAPAEGAGAGR
jgi:hypothetical protein